MSYYAGMDRISQLKKSALKFRSEQKYRLAAEAYNELMELEPHEPTWPHKLGEAQRSMGQDADAIASFQAAAENYSTRGFILKAIAVYKMILGLDPQNAPAQHSLLRLHLRPGDFIRGEAGAQPAGEPGSVAAPLPRPAPLSGPAPEPRQVSGPGPRPGPLPLRYGEIDLERTEPASQQSRAASNLKSQPGPARPPALAPVSVRSRPPVARDKAPPAPAAEPPPVASVLVRPPPVQDPGPASSHQSLDDILLTLVLPEARPVSELIDEEPVYEIPLAPVQLEEPGPGELLMDRMAPIPLLSSLSRAELRSFLGRVEVREFQPGEAIIRQGSQDDTLFVLAEGSVQILREEQPRVLLGRLQEGAFFGEYALLAHQERSATVEAEQECTVLCLSRKVTLELIREHPAVLRVLLSFFRERLVGNLTATHPLFQPFTEEERRGLVERFAFLEAPSGRVLVRAGEPPDGLYMLLSGRVLVEPTGGWLPVMLGTGEMFCKTALINSRPSANTVYTRSKCWLLRMDRDQFREVIMTHPHVLATIAEAGITGRHQPVDLDRADHEQTLKLV